MTPPPLLRFVLIGSLLFMTESLLADNPTEGAAPLTLSTATQRLIVNEEEQRQGRKLTAEEVEHALRAWENETLLVRDARRLGLATHDPIIRRRMAEKMRYLIEDAATVTPPTDEALTAYLERNQQQFMLPAQVAIDQRFFSREIRGAGMDSDAQAGLRLLRSGEPERGDSHPLGESLPLQTEQALSRRLGAVFAQRALDAPVGTWSGPIASSTGLHLIRVNVHQPARPAKLEERRAHVEASWRANEREQRLRAQLDALRRRRGLPERRSP